MAAFSSRIRYLGIIPMSELILQFKNQNKTLEDMTSTVDESNASSIFRRIDCLLKLISESLNRWIRDWCYVIECEVGFVKIDNVCVNMCRIDCRGDQLRRDQMRNRRQLYRWKLYLSNRLCKH